MAEGGKVEPLGTDQVVTKANAVTLLVVLWLLPTFAVGIPTAACGDSNRSRTERRDGSLKSRSPG